MNSTPSSRVNNSKRNVSYGIIVTILGTLVSFANRTAFVKCLGVSYLGLNGLFGEVLAMLSLAELGVGMAINYSLYKPIHEHDYTRINQLMSLFRKTYNFVAIFIFGIGLILLPFVHLFVNGIDFSLSYIRLVFFLFLVSTSVSYLFSYNTSFLNAAQKQYIVSLTSALLNVSFAVFNIILLVLYHNYVLTLILMIIQTLTANIIVTIYVKKKYSFITYNDDLSLEDRKKIFIDIKNIFIKKVSGVITSSTTNVLISTLVSTIQVGYYSNYSVLIGVVRTLNRQFASGIKASIGDLTATETPERCILVLNRLTFMFFMFSLVISSLLISVISDFIILWLGEGYVMSKMIVYVIVLNLFIEICCEPLWQFLEVSGLFKQDRNIAILGSSINILIAVWLGQAIGIVGIFCGTLSTQIIQLFLKSKLIYDRMFYSSVWGYWCLWFKLLLTFIICVLIQYYLNMHIETQMPIINFVLKALSTFFVSLTILFITFHNSPEYVYCINFVKEIVKNRKND